MKELPTELMYILRRVTIFRVLCYVKLFIQVSQLKCDSLSILQVGFPVNTIPVVLFVAVPLSLHYFQLPDPNMDYNPSDFQVYD